MSSRADRWGALAWIVLGSAISVGAWNMDRLEKFQVKSYEAPGLVPGLLGAVIVLLGLTLLARAAFGQTAPDSGDGDSAAGESRQAVVIGLGLSLAYALVLIGRGLPFWAATFLYVAPFVTLLDGERQRSLGRSTANIAIRASVFAAIVSLVITLVFQHVFLVRLP